MIFENIGLILTGIGVILTFWKLWLIEKQQKRHYTWEMRRNALSYSITKSSRLREARITLENGFGPLEGREEPLTCKEIKEANKKTPRGVSILTDIEYLLAHWENMALAIHAKVADESVAFEMVGGVVCNYVRVFRNYIDEKRKYNRRKYDYLIQLQRKWDARLRNVERPLFPDLRIM